MNIYLITQNVNTGWDTYDAMVVVAETKERAKILTLEDRDDHILTWTKFEHLECTLLGKAVKGSEEKIVFQSFNAG
jgi:hypothetical protein